MRTSITLPPVIEDSDNVILRLKVAPPVAAFDAINDNMANIALKSGDESFPCTPSDAPSGYCINNTFESKPFEIYNNEFGPEKSPAVTVSGASATVSHSTTLRVVNLLRDFEEKARQNEWPSSTSVCCYWCCHKFEGPPFGMPVKMVDEVFHVSGCFCSLECATAYNYASNDSMEEIWERQNLTNMLAKMLDFAVPIKPAPNRLVLKMFGGVFDIDEFRAYTASGKVMCANFPPMVTVTQQIEETHESDITCDHKFIPLDNDRIKRYKEKLKLRRTKPLVNPKNTLDHSMNVKIHS